MAAANASLSLLIGAALAGAAAAARAQASDFVQWESPHVHPLDQTADGARLVAVNTPDARVAVFSLEGALPSLEFEVAVGLEPVSVRCESATRAWVVNQLSDSVSIVDLARRTVVATLSTEDEPADVVFAGTPRRAYVSCTQSNALLLFDPADLRAPPQRIELDGEEPRALAVAADGATVYVALFESGNGSTLLAGGSLFNLDFPPNVVGRPFTPYSGRNPPPNSSREGGFEPPLAPGLPPPPAVGLIVKRNAAGEWRDDFVGDWSVLVSGAQAARSGRVPGWDLVDHDLAALDCASGTVRYARGLMNLCMALAVQPGSGAVTLVGTDARNEIRFEPNLRGRFLEVVAAQVDFGRADARPASERSDLNPHLDGARPTTAATVPAALRAASLGDPRAVAWQRDGRRAFVAGMGSNSLIALDASGRRAAGAPIAVGEGPTGLVLDEARGRLYVLCKFESALAVVDLATQAEQGRVPFFDPSPPVVRAGRRHLYATQRHSAQGQLACGSCHVDARADRLAWDLGDPSGALQPLHDVNRAADDPQLLESLVPGRGAFEPFHPMKGPMVTQSLQDVVGKEPLHWRGDRSGLGAFREAFVSLQGGGAPLSAEELADFTGFLATIAFPPNPFRTLEDELPSALPLPGLRTTGRFGPTGEPLPPGDTRRGFERFQSGKLDNAKVDCIRCHTLPTGLGPDARLVDDRFVAFAPTAAGERHHMLVAQDGSTNVTMKVPQLRALHEKIGCDLSAAQSRLGFGFLHDGSVDTLARFLNEVQFSVASDQETADLAAFLLAFPDGPQDGGDPASAPARRIHAAIGQQVTLLGDDAAAEARARRLLALAASGAVRVIAKGQFAGEPRGFVQLEGDSFASDRGGEPLPFTALLERARAGEPVTLTVVPLASARRMGIDRDGDGVLDGEEARAAR